MRPPVIRFVVATRGTREDFFLRTGTGRSLALYKYPFVRLDLSANNAEGLPAVYNRSIRAAEDPGEVLVFIHDDVLLPDYYWPDQVVASLTRFQIVGLAGNRRRVPKQPSWAFVDGNFTWDARENLSGVVGHGTGFPPHSLDVFGPPRQQVKLLDGVLLIAYRRTLVDNGLSFDERFGFHFYDLDLCRQAEAKGVSMGTWSISAIHESIGGFTSSGWSEDRDRYFDKWKE